MFYVVLLIAVAVVSFAARLMWHALQTSPRPAMTEDVRSARRRLAVAARRLRRSERSATWSFGNTSPNRG